jgi:carboxypeptidase C (cathepsin A)
MADQTPPETAAEGAGPKGSAAPAATSTDTTTTAPAPPTDDLVTTKHTLKVGRRTLKYTATTGRVVLREEVYEDKVFTGHRPKAEVFMTSYVVPPERPDKRDKASSPRPVTFAFNGGPGSSSVWLHLGLLGPRRVLMGDAGALLPPPYGLADNPESLLAVSDLVFIDPVDTGYSRAVEGGKAEPYLGYQGDIDSVGEIIRLWTSRNGRWMSPKFLAGESYGTLRAAALAEHLQTRHGLYLNGVVLVSAVLDFATIDFDFRNDRASVGYLPTYAATAQYHGKHGRRGLRGVLEEAEAYAARDYPWALAQGSRLTPAERAEAVATLARLCGLSEDYVDRANLRLEHIRYFTELLRDQRLAVGRLDTRFTGPAASGIAEGWDADPSHDAISGPYAAAWNHYVRDELGYASDLPYEQISSKTHKAWSYKEFTAKPVDVTDKLARAMRANPHLRVHVAYGYLDGATPYYAVEDSFAHLDIPESLRANIEHRYYEAGHMMYVHEPSRLQQSADLADFVTRAASLPAPGSAPTPGSG